MTDHDGFQQDYCIPYVRLGHEKWETLGCLRKVIYDNGVFGFYVVFFLFRSAHGNRERTGDVMSVCTSCRS